MAQHPWLRRTHPACQATWTQHQVCHSMLFIMFFKPYKWITTCIVSSIKQMFNKISTFAWNFVLIAFVKLKQVCGCCDDNSQGDFVPDVWNESGFRQGAHWPCYVFWANGWWSTHWKIRRYVGWLVLQGIIWSWLIFLLFISVSDESMYKNGNQLCYIKRDTWLVFVFAPYIPCSDPICIHILMLMDSCGAGDLWPFESGCEDRAAIPLAQQGKQPICKPEERIQGYLLAGGDHPILPICCPPKRMHHSAEMLHWALKTSQGQAQFCWSLLSEASRCHGYMDWSLGGAQPITKCCSDGNSSSTHHTSQVEKALNYLDIIGFPLLPLIFSSVCLCVLEYLLYSYLLGRFHLVGPPATI